MRILKIVKEREGEFWQIYCQLRRNRLAIVGILIIIFFITSALFAPFLATHDPLSASLSDALQSASKVHLLGTDEMGRDSLSRLLYGARISLTIGIISVLIGVSVGMPIGAFSGYFGGKFDLIVQRLIDVMMSFPPLLLAIIVVCVTGPGLQNVMVAVGIASVPRYARLVRGAVLSVKEMKYVIAGRSLGLSDSRIILRHIMPNCLGPIIVQSTFQIANCILLAAGLGFLGMGTQPPTPEWGTMLGKGRLYMRIYPQLTIYPGLAIFLVVLGFNLLGDGLRDALDPRDRER
ncbi:MAG: ABC transporter permease [Promethearchaeota archaeon]